MKLILSLGPKEFATGIAPNAHSVSSGLFYKADGVTSMYEPGTDQSANNGLLMPGQSATTVSGSLTGKIIGATKELSGASNAYFSTAVGDLFKLQLDNTFGSALSNLRTVSGLTSGLEVFKTAGAASYLYYWQLNQIGRYDLSATYVDAWATGLATDYIHATHRYFNSIIYTNGLGLIGTLRDVAGVPTINNSALAIPANMKATDISDDSFYAVIAITDNILCDPNAIADTRIIFWDGTNTIAWTKEYPINDPFIYALEKTPIGLFAFGVTGIWQVSFGGVKKVYSRSTGIYSVSGSNQITYGKAVASYFVNALLWGGASGSNKVVKSFGHLDSNEKAATIYPFLSTAAKNITYLDGQLLKGWVFVGDDTPQLKAYPFSTANAPQTGLSAQTIYFNLNSKYDLQKINIIFGEPLVSGDSMSIQLKKDEDTASITATTALTASYAQDGAIRRKNMRITGFTADEQASIVINFISGIPKIRRIELYGEPIETP